MEAAAQLSDALEELREAHEATKLRLEELNAPIDIIGKTVDLLNIKLAKCQLGLFGYKPKKKLLKPSNLTDPELKDAISEALVEKRLSCERAWGISSRFKVSKITVSSTCEFLGIKINDCQLGAF